MAPGAGMAQTIDWGIAAKVTTVEASHMPNEVLFRIDAAAGACAAGTYMHWSIQGADAATKAQNAQAVYALLLTAKATGQSITMYGDNATCSAYFIYLT